MKNEYEELVYYFDNKYWSFYELYEMYREIPFDRKKTFKDCLAHYGLIVILRRCNYDRTIISIIEELCKKEVDIINHGFIKRFFFSKNKNYNAKLRKLLNAKGLITDKSDESSISEFINGEWLLNKIVSLTIGSSYNRITIEDFSLIDYNSLSDDVCLAIANNFIRNMNNEEIVFYNAPRQLRKN